MYAIRSYYVETFVVSERPIREYIQFTGELNKYLDKKTILKIKEIDISYNSTNNPRETVTFERIVLDLIYDENKWTNKL